MISPLDLMESWISAYPLLGLVVVILMFAGLIVACMGFCVMMMSEYHDYPRPVRRRNIIHGAAWMVVGLLLVGWWVMAIIVTIIGALMLREIRVGRDRQAL